MLLALVGTFVIAMPRCGTNIAPDTLTWAGLPYAGELGVVVLCVLAAMAMHMADDVPAAAMVPWASPRTLCKASAIVMALFEMGCALLVAPRTPQALCLVDKCLRSAALLAWLRAVHEEGRASDGSARGVGRRLGGGRLAWGGAAMGLSCASGMVWYGACQAANSLGASLAAQLGVWAATLGWAFPTACLVVGASDGGARSLGASVMPFFGALVGNRLFFLASGLGVPVGALARPAWILGLVAALLACLALLLAHVAARRADAAPSKPRGEQGDAAAWRRGDARAAALDRVLWGSPAYAALGERERGALCLGLLGYDAADIAPRIRTSASTAATYLSRARGKVAPSVTGVPGLALAVSHDDAAGGLGARRRAAGRRLAAGFAVALLASCALAFLRLNCAQAVRCALSGGAALFALGLGVVDMRAGRGATPPCRAVGSRSLHVGLLMGCVLGIEVAQLLHGPRLYLPASIVGALVAGALTAVVGGTSSREGDAVSWPCLLAFGVVLFALSPPGVNAERALRLLLASWLPASLLLLSAWELRRRERSERAAAIGDVVAAGDKRVLSYLEGRGLGDLQAKVVLLTAHGFGRTFIARSLSVAPSTVSTYRARAYRTLSVGTRDELTRLLVREAGLHVPVEATGGEEAS